MTKILSMAGLAVSALILLVFVLDLATGLPFGGVNSTMNFCFIITSGVLGYMSWTAWQEAT